MKYYKKILKYLIPVWMLIFSSICQSQDFTIDLTLLNTGQFTLHSWNSVNRLWEVTVINSTAIEIEYILEFQLNNKVGDMLSYGFTRQFFIGPQTSRTYTNLDADFNKENLRVYEENDDFLSNINNQLGYFTPRYLYISNQCI